MIRKKTNPNLVARNRRAQRLNSRVKGTPKRPRLSVYISNLNVTAQLIDDESGKTLAYASSANNKKASGSLSDKAVLVGKDIAVKASKHKIKRVVFDRHGRLYHGRVKHLADSAREQGLEF